MKILSIQVGKPITVGKAGAAQPMDREWTTGFFKEGINGPVVTGENGLEGDGQADLKVHGGPDKAINVYPADHFPAWSKELNLDFPNGAFGENLTTFGSLESEVCVGDIFEVNGVELQITQPREPCWKLARRWKIKDLAARVEQSGRTGWYFRVLIPGSLTAGTELRLIERPFPEWTITYANQIMHHQKSDWQLARRLSECAALSEIWKGALARRAAKREIESSAARLGGNDD